MRLRSARVTVFKLPREILDLIILEIKLSSTVEEFKATLKSLSLVSKIFYFPVRQQEYQKIELYRRFQVISLINKIRNRIVLGSFTKELVIQYDEFTLKDNLKEEETRVELDDVSILLELLPNVLTIEITMWNYSVSKPSLYHIRLPLLSSVRKFILNFPISNKQSEDIIHHWVNQMPNVESLNVSVTPEYGPYVLTDSPTLTPITISTFPYDFLEVLVGREFPAEDVFEGKNAARGHWMDTIISRFPITSFFGLKHLRVSACFSADQVLEVVKISGPTLDSFGITHDLLGDVSTYASLVVPLFPYLLAITTLYVEDMSILTPTNVLSLIPSTVTHLVQNSGIQHLKHLHYHPRQDLQLESIIFCGSNPAFINFVPLSVNHIELMGEVLMLAEILDIMKSNARKKVITFTFSANEEDFAVITATSLASLVEEYKDAGFILEVKWPAGDF